MRAPTTEETLRDLGASFSRRPDGTLVVEHNIQISYQGLTELPDLSAVIVKGDFRCDNNKLTSLKGAPREVTGDFWCQNNNLPGLEYAPDSIGGDFVCTSNPLACLDTVPRRFQELRSDFGNFKSGADIPDAVRLHPEVRTRMAEEQASKNTLEYLRTIAKENRVKLKKPGIK